jgi:hypothetical protein
LTDYTRRQVVLSLAALGLTPLTGLAADKTALDLNSKQRLPGELPPVLSPDIVQALSESPLVYLSPLDHNGNPSRCQAEIWFVMVQDALLVCTDSKSWRARAAATARQHTQIWVGDVGVWETGFDRHLKLPSLRATASIEGAPEAVEAALEAFGEKYPIQWLLWGNRFRRGLADGSRVMLSYWPNPA